MSALVLWYYWHRHLLETQRSKDAIVVKIELSCRTQHVNIGSIVIRRHNKFWLTCSTFAGRPPSESLPHPTTWNSKALKSVEFTRSSPVLSFPKEYFWSTFFPRASQQLFSLVEVRHGKVFDCWHLKVWVSNQTKKMKCISFSSFTEFMFRATEARGKVFIWDMSFYCTHCCVLIIITAVFVGETDLTTTTNVNANVRNIFMNIWWKC